MATTSLWYDELFIIKTFISRGVWVSWTDYHHAGNHVLFDMLAALAPGSGSFEPLPARALSFALVGLALAVLLGGFWARRLYLEGAAAAALVASSQPHLDLMLQVRGYGVLTLCAVLATFALFRALADPTRGALATLALAVAAGTAAVPVFLLFGGPLLALTCLARPGRRTLLAAGLAGALTLAFYTPTLGQLASAAADQRERWGAPYVGAYAVLGTFQTFLLDRLRVGHIAAVLLVTGLGVLLVRPADPGLRRGLPIVAASIAVFLGACLAMETPPPRATAFVVVPFTIVIVLLASHLVRGRAAAVPATVAVAVTGLLVTHALARVPAFAFVPIENWKQVAETVRLVAPPGTPVYVSLRGEYLQAYLPPEFPVLPALDAERFRAGTLVVVDSDPRPQRRLDLSGLAARTLELRVPQRRGDFQRVLLVPADGRHVARVSARAPASGTEPGSSPPAPLTLDIQLEPGRRYRTLIAYGDIGPAGTAGAWVVHDGSPRPLAPDRLHHLSGLLAVELGDTRLDGVTLSLRPGAVIDPAAKDPPVRLWAVSANPEGTPSR